MTITYETKSNYVVIWNCDDNSKSVMKNVTYNDVIEFCRYRIDSGEIGDTLSDYYAAWVIEEESGCVLCEVVSDDLAEYLKNVDSLL